jgi:hypothetical protein
VVVAGGVAVFEPEGETCPTPLSKVTEVALVEVHVSVVDELKMTVVGWAVSANVGGTWVPCDTGVDGDFPPEQAVNGTTNRRAAALLNMCPIPGGEKVTIYYRFGSQMMPDNGRRYKLYGCYWISRINPENCEGLYRRPRSGPA